MQIFDHDIRHQPFDILVPLHEIRGLDAKVRLIELDRLVLVKFIAHNLPFQKGLTKVHNVALLPNPHPYPN